jgi:hypothetical protein
VSRDQNNSADPTLSSVEVSSSRRLGRTISPKSEHRERRRYPLGTSREKTLQERLTGEYYMSPRDEVRCGNLPQYGEKDGLSMARTQFHRTAFCSSRKRRRQRLRQRIGEPDLIIHLPPVIFRAVIEQQNLVSWITD